MRWGSWAADVCACPTDGLSAEGRAGMNAFRLSLRYIKSRKLESSLAIGGIVLGVATLAGTLSLISSYESYYDKFSQSPESRQITVMQSSRVRVTDEPAVLIGAAEISNIRFTAADVEAALDVCPDVEAYYEAEFRQFYTTASSSSSGFFGGGLGGGPGGGMGAAPAAPSSGTAGGSGTGERSGPESAPEGGSAALPEIDTTIEKPTLERIGGALVSGGFFDAYSLRAEYGDVFSNAADNSGVPGAVIGANLAKTLYASTNNPADLIGRKLVLNNTTYSIIGVLAYDEWNSSGRNISFNDMAFVPTMAMRSGSAARAMFRNVLFYTKINGSPAAAAVQLENYFNSIHGEGAVVAEANLEMFSNEVTKRQRILTLIAILASASALTAAVNLFNLMTSRVMRRRRPIAIMRAIGAWNRRVFGQIMIEAAVIGTSGAVLGMACSPIVVGILARMLENSASGQSIPVSISVPVLAAVGLGALAVSLVFAAIPARSGSNLVITDALRSE